MSFKSRDRKLGDLPKYAVFVKKVLVKKVLVKKVLVKKVLVKKILVRSVGSCLE